MSNVGLWVLVVGLFLAAPAATRAQQQASAQSDPKSEGQKATSCHSCGVEILEEADAFDDDGNPLCAKCAAKLSAGKGEAKAYDLRTTKRLTGDWGGVRTELEDAGITLKLTSQTQFMVNMHGGKETKNGNDFGGSYDFTLLLDFQKMGLVDGGSFFLRAKGTFGGEASDFDKEKIGGLFKTNQDAGTEEPIYVDKWWWRQRMLDGRIEFRLGRLESKKALFDVNKVAGSEEKQFLNGALVTNPTIPHEIGLGAYLNFWPNDWHYVRAAVVDPETRARRTGFDTAFHGEDRWRAFAEVGFVPQVDSPNGKLPGHYRFGTWYHPRPRAVFRDTLGGLLAPRSRSGDAGFYFGCDQLVWKESDKPKDEQGVSVFARYGFAHGDVNKMQHFWSIGGQYVGLVPGRDKDTVGLGMAQAILSGQYHDEVRDRADRETVCELYYAYHVTPWCVITPDVQFVTNPGGDKDDRDAFVAGLRLRVWF